MSQQQGRITENLAETITIIQRNRMSGELRARRSDDIQNEIGSIIFTDGQVVYAQVGSYRGPVALQVLSTWKQCIFIFVASSRANTDQSSYNPYQTPSQSSPALPQHSPALPNPNMLPPDRQSHPFLPTPQYKTPLPPDEHQQRETSADPQLQHVVPRATMSVVKAIGVINKAGLPYSYRQVLLLIDGRHSINDLVTMSNISYEEILQILRTLESLAIIVLPR